jgi:hypothetical protein
MIQDILDKMIILADKPCTIGDVFIILMVVIWINYIIKETR